MLKPSLYLIAFFLLLHLTSCTKPNYRRAQVLMTGAPSGFFEQSQLSMIAYENDSGNLVVQRVKLPDYTKIARPGDSVEISGNYPNLDFGALIKFPKKTEDGKALYIRHQSGWHEHLFFERGILFYYVLDNKDEFIEWSFYNYLAEPDEDQVLAYDLGVNSEPYFRITGDIHGEFLFVENQPEPFYLLKSF